MNLIPTSSCGARAAGALPAMNLVSRSHCMPRQPFSLLFLSLALALAACGGGAGSSDAGPPPAPVGPSLVSLAPAEGTSGVSLDASLVATFARGLDAAEAEGLAVSLHDVALGVDVPVRREAEGASIVLRPQSPDSTPPLRLASVYEARAVGTASRFTTRDGTWGDYRPFANGFSPSPMGMGSDAAGNVLLVSGKTLDTTLSIFRFDAVSGEWEEPMVLEPGMAGSARMVVSPAGAALVLWIRRDANKDHLVGRAFDPVSRTWHPERPLASADLHALGDYAVAIDDAGNATAAWTVHAGQASLPWVARFDMASQAWRDIRLLEAADGAPAPEGEAASVSVATGPGGQAIIGWVQGAGGEMRAWTARHAAAGFLAASALPDATAVSDIQVGMDAAGNAAVATRQESSLFFRRALPQQDAWEPPHRVVQHAQLSTEWKFALGRQGIAVLMWSKSIAPTPVEAYVSQPATAAAQGETVTLAEAPGVLATSNPEAVVDASGNILAAWSGRDGVRNMFAKRYTAAGGWHATQPLSEGLPAGSHYFPQLSLDRAGRAVLVWLWAGSGNQSMGMSRRFR